MAHELEQHGQHVAYVDTRDDAWHRLNELPNNLRGKPLTAEKALSIAHLADWNVRKEPAYTTINGQSLRIPGSYATVRDNPWVPGQVDVLGSVGEQWSAFQNEELAGFLNALTHESHGKIETAGSLRGGREVFVTMKMPDTMTVGGVDDVDLYIAALTAHDGTKSTRFLATGVRIVCANTQRMAESAAVSTASIRHTSGQTKYVEVARQKLGLAFKVFEDFQAEAERMIQTTQTEAEFVSLVDTLFPFDEESKRGMTVANQRRDDLMDLWGNADTQKNIRGTRWAGFQAVTEWLDHYAPINGTKGDAHKAELARAERAITGIGQGPIRNQLFALSRAPA